MNENIITLVGRLAQNPILKPYNTKDGKEGFRSFMRVAVTRLGDLGKKQDERRTNFIPVVAWGQTAQRIAQYLSKGTEVTVRGELISESKLIVDDAGQAILKDGKKQYRDFTHVQVDRIQFGRPSLKNSSPEQLANQATALQGAMAAMSAAADGQTPTPETGAPMADGAGADNPFPADGASA